MSISINCSHTDTLLRRHAWDALTPASGSAFRAGWTIGAGIETVLAPNWTFKFEYLYMDLGSTFSTSYLASLKRSVSETISSV
jgi:outer membrane immunogenic protein